MTKVCAFMSLFNEEDVIEETIQKMIGNDVDIFILDNGCTDKTIEKVNKYVGKGVLDIVHFVTEEDGRKVFRLSDILEQFELTARKLPHDWFLISDADEIKYSPWRSMTLREGVERVDAMGYNLINFKLFDFRPVDEIFDHTDYEIGMQYYSAPERSSAIQMKCWKRSDVFDIKSFGGHVISVPAPKLFPVKFINKHYPIRSADHGFKKLKFERATRYSPSELKKGWHSHYSNINPDDPAGMRWSKEKLVRFEMTVERSILHEEAIMNFADSGLLYAAQNDETLQNSVLTYAQKNNICNMEHARDIFKVARNIYEMSAQYQLPPIEVSSEDECLMQMVIASLRSRDYLNGELLRVRNSEGIRLEITSR